MTKCKCYFRCIRRDNKDC